MKPLQQAHPSLREHIPLKEFEAVRSMTDHLIEPLSPEDMVVQSMTDASPAKWHIAHVSWFFEEFLLVPFCPNYQRYHPHYAFFYNSYYNAVGERWVRPHRGLQTKPSIDEVIEYRHHITHTMIAFIHQCQKGDIRSDFLSDIIHRIHIGIHHEQQHQELLLMDILHVFSHNPLSPAYRPSTPAVMRDATPLTWHDYEGGMTAIGHDGDDFCYDHEKPYHRCFLNPYQLAHRPVTNGEWLDFIEDGGYERHELWLSDGWDYVSHHDVRHPLYWQRHSEGEWSVMTLHGMMPINLHASVVHISYYEAMAFARWMDARLPTEAEWEHAARQSHHTGAFLENECLYSQALPHDDGSMQTMLGGVWEWTMSAFLPYHGYRTPEGAIGEYNAKFMSGQMIMRGGSFGTARQHMRHSYRNFFYPAMRWQFGGVRLARDEALS